MTLTRQQIIDGIRRVAPSDGSVLIAVVFCSGDVQGDESRNVPFVIPPDMPIEEIEREAILQTLARTSGNVKRSAQILRYPRPTFYRKLKKFGIKVDRTGPRSAGKLATSA